MMTKKRIISLFLSLVIIFSMFPITDISVFAAAENIVDYLTYEIHDGEIIITDCDESISGDVVIPDTIDGYPVTAIGEYAFSYCHNMESVFIPSSVASLGWRAFSDSSEQGCRSLKSVVIEGGDIEYVEKPDYGYSGQTFLFCENLESVTIGEGVKTIGDEMFAYCSSLIDVNLPESLIEISDGAFSLCISLKDISLPKSLEIIGEGAFGDCLSIENIVLPDNVTTIGIAAFANCVNLETANIPQGVSVVGEGAFSNCFSLKSISIPKTVTGIENRAFENCWSLEDIYIYNPVANIAEGAINNIGLKFSNITAAEYADMMAEINKMYESGDYTDEEMAEIEAEFSAISGEPQECVIDFTIHGYNNSTASAYAQQYNINFEAFADETDVADYLSYEIIDGEVTITDCFDMFRGDMIIPETIEGYPVTAIGDSSFEGKYFIQSISIPDTVTSIGSNAFSACISLKNINIPTGITEIKDAAFAACYSLEVITIPDGLTTIGYGAFSECLKLSTINIPDSVALIADGVFSGCMCLEKITLPESVEVVGDYAFENAVSITDIYIYNSDVELGESFITADSVRFASMTIQEYARTYADYIVEMTQAELNGATEDEINEIYLKYEDFFMAESELEEIKSNIVIHGYSGSTAQAYAEENDHLFVSFGNECEHLNTEFRNSVDATCVAEGFTGDLCCSDCGENLADGRIVPVSVLHTCGDWEIVSEPTCTQMGIKMRECRFCEATEEREIAATGHKDADADDLCDVCGESTCYIINVNETITVDVSGGAITLVKFIPEETATYKFFSASDQYSYNDTYGYLYDSDMNELTRNDDDGGNGNFLIEYKLTAGETYYFGCRYYDSYSSGSFDVTLIKGCDHDYITTVTPPTCTEQGYTTYTCSECGDSYTDDYVSSGHSFSTENEFCVNCGENIIVGLLTYSIENGEVTITGCYSYVVSVVIPETIEGYPVTKIDDYAFAYCYNLENITICNNITTIGSNAFCNCSSLTNIVIPDSVKTIGTYVFECCNSLKNVTIGKGVTIIGYRAFSTFMLESIFVDEDNENYSSDKYGVLFNKDKTLLIQYPAGNNRTEYTIPDSVTIVEEYAFNNCNSLTNIIIPDSVTSIGESAFSSNNGLKNIIIPDSITTISANAFNGCSNLESVIIPDSVTTIEYQAFEYCNSLVNITIPDSVKSIGMYAFYSCDSLENVTIKNPECSIYDSSSTISSDAIIYGYPGSTAEAYAEKYNRTFVSICKNHGYDSVVTPPTCTEQGYTTYTCAECGDSYVSDYVSETDHTDNNSDGCCDNCKYYLYYTINAGETITVDIISDEVTKIKFIPEKTGVYKLYSVSNNDTYGYIYDSDMNQLTCDDDSGDSSNFLVEYELIAGETYYFGCRYFNVYSSGSFDVKLEKVSHEHNYISTVTPPACSEQGYTTYICSECGDSYVSDYVSSLGHEGVVKEVVIPTCMTVGYTTYTCNICGIDYNENYVAALGHNFSEEWIVDIEATCTQTGSKSHHCSRCDAKSDVTAISAIGHTFSTENEFCTECGENIIAGLLEYKIENDEVTITDCASYVVSVVIPETIEGYPVTKIDDYAFLDCFSLVNVTIGNNVTTIGTYAFSGCSSLECIIIPHSVTLIGFQAFFVWGELNAKVYYDGSKADFGRISGYNYVPSTDIYYAKESEFLDYFDYLIVNETVTITKCSRMISGEISIPATIEGYPVTVIGDNAFSDCYSLEKVIIGKNVTEIGEHAFYNCDSIDIVINNYNCSIFDSSYTFGFDATLYGYPGSTAQAYAENHYVTFVSICEHNLDSIVNPPACEKQGYTTYSCAECDYSYTDNYIPATGHTFSTENEFCTVCGENLIKGLLTYTIENGEVTITDCAFYVVSVVIPETIEGYPVTEIADEVFYDHQKLISVILCNNIEKIGEQAFEYCDNIKNLTIQNPSCSIFDDSNTIYRDVIIYSYPHSTAHVYAEKYGRTFVSLCEHDMEAVVTLPTCTEQGYTTYSCSECEKIYKGRYVYALGHHYDSVVTVPTCTERGYTTKTCSVCSYSYKTDYKSETGHKRTTKHEFCTVCGESLIKGVLSYLISDGEVIIADCADYATNVVIPETIEGYPVTAIRKTAFQNCYVISISIPYTITLIPDNAFYNCDGISSITVDPANAYYSSDEDGVLFNKDKTELIQYPICNYKTEYTIPNSVKKICTHAFYGCDAIKTVIIPKNVTEIGFGAFGFSDYLKEIKIYNSRCIIADSFATIDEDVTIYGYPGSTAQFYAEEYDRTFVSLCEHEPETFVTPPTCTEQGYTTYLCAEYGCLYVSNIVPATGHTFSTENEFCTVCGENLINGLLSYSIKNGEVTITDCASYVVSIVIPETIEGYPVTTIGNNAFYECNNLEKVIIGDNVTTINDYAFPYCTRLKNVTIGKNVEKIGVSAFAHCDDLLNIIIPDSVTIIDDYAFYNCYTLANVKIGKNVTIIGDYAFYNCDELDTVIIPDSVTAIEYFAFYGCNGLKNVSFFDPDCFIADSANTIYSGTVIYGYHGSTAQTYAEKYSRTFVSLCGQESETVETPPTCTAQGYTTYLCAECGIDYNENYVPALGHNFSEEWTIDIEATCTTVGSKSHHCSRCDEKSDVTEILALGHAWSDWTTVTEPDCVTTGLEKRTCSRCSAEEENVIPALGHDFSEEWTIDIEATCTIVGSKSHHCSRCNEKSDVTEIPAHGHEFGDWATVSEPTCTTDGKEERVCSICNCKEINVLPMYGHDYDAVVTAPTCTVVGFTTYTCARCSHTYKADHVPVVPHPYGEWVIIKDATVLSEGEKTHKCTACDHEEKVITEKVYIDIENTDDYGLANFTVVNAQTLEPIENASIFISTENDGENTFTTDENGKVSIILPVGKQTVSAYAEGCLVKNLKVNIKPGENEIPKIGLSDQKTYDATLDHHLMTYEEIKEAGIDVNATENQHVYKYELELVFAPEIDIESIFFYFGENGTVLGGGFGWDGPVWVNDDNGKGHVCIPRENEPDINVYPVSEYCYLIIQGEIRWLKEMFDVEMLVFNNSMTDTLEDMVATLTLPEGLSLATMVNGEQTLSQYLGTIAEGESKSAHWYVRGDTAGSYDISANLTGKVMPFEEEINDTYVASNQLQVWAGDALNLHFELPEKAYYGDDYTITITLTNVSDITLYNVSHAITGIEQSRVTHYSNGKVESEVYMDKGFIDSEFAKEFKPGDKIVIELSANILFESKLMEYRLQQYIGIVDSFEEFFIGWKAVNAIGEMATDLIETVTDSYKAIDEFLKNADLNDIFDDAFVSNAKLKLFKELYSKTSTLCTKYSTSGNETLDSAVKFLNAGVITSLNIIAEDPVEYFSETAIEDMEELIDSLSAFEKSVVTDEDIKKFDIFDSLRTAISALPICFVLKDVILTEDANNTTSIPWSYSVTDTGPRYFGVTNVSSYFGNLFKGLVAEFYDEAIDDLGIISVIPGIDDPFNYDEIKREIIAVEKEIAAFKAKGATGEVKFRAWIESNDDFEISCDNKTTTSEGGVIEFTGDGTISVIPSEGATDGKLIVEDSEGNKYEYEMTIVEKHDCVAGERQIILNPTEDSDGYAVRCCEICGDILDVETLSATACKEHSYGSWTIDSSAICDVNGIKTRECTECGYCQVEYIDATGHSYGEWETVTEATCTTDGLKKRVCSKCENTEEELISSTQEHKYSSLVTAPTCTEQGFTTYVCSACNDTYVNDYVDATGHTWSNRTTVTEATCTTDGLEKRACSACSAEEENVLAALGHDFSEEWTVDVEATCTSVGSKSHHCSRCDEKSDVTEIEKAEHILQYSEIASTCNVAGVSYDICLVCMDMFNYNVLPLAAHTWSGWATVTEPTCTATGLEKRVCSVCNEEETNILAAIDHRYSANVTAPTCTEMGYTTYTCGTCNDSYKSDYVDATGHSFGEWSETVAPTFINFGEETRVCEKCGFAEKNRLDKLVPTEEVVNVETGVSVSITDNTYEGDITVDVTPIYDGESYQLINAQIGNYAATVYDITTYINGEKVQPSGMVLVKMPIPAGYNPDKLVIYYIPNDGSAPQKMNSYVEGNYICFETNHFSEYAIIDESQEAEHDYRATVTPPACTEKGYTTYVCSICNDTYVDNYVDATGHDFSAEWIVDVAATCMAVGIKSHHCTRCDAKAEATEIPATGHNIVIVGSVAATCTETGLTEGKYCSVCNEVIEKQKEIPALGHDWSDELVCNHCGVSKGDVDGDGYVNSNDAIHLLYHTMLPERYEINQNCDFNGDGYVNSNDAIYLLYHTMLPERYPLP